MSPPIGCERRPLRSPKSLCHHPVSQVCPSGMEPGRAVVLVTRTPKETGENPDQGGALGAISPSRGFLVARAAPNHTQKISRPAPKKTPSQCILCSSAPGSGPTGCPPHPSPRCLIVPASRPPAPNGFLRSCLFPSSCLRDARELRSCLSPEIRHRRAAGQGRRPPFLARAPLLFGIPRKKKTTGVISGFTAPEKVLAHPQAQKGRQAARGSPVPPREPRLSPLSSPGTR